MTVDGHRAYLTLDFAPAPHQLVEVTSVSWTRSELTDFASKPRFAADLTDVQTWFDARSAVP